MLLARLAQGAPVKRFKWYQLDLHSSFKGFLTSVGKARFGSGLRSGFVAIEAPRGEHSFRFFWTGYLSQVTLGTDGASHIEQVPTLEHCEIALFEARDRFWMRVADPPRSLRELLNALEHAAGFGFSSTSVTLLENNRVPSFPRGTEKKLVSFKAVSSLPQEAAIARIEAASREGIELREFSLLKNTKFALEQLTYDVTYKRVKGQVSLTNSGTLRVSGPLSPLLLESFEAMITAP